MRLTIEAGTDGGSVCCFDPAALPADFDQLTAAGGIETIEQLTTEGRFWWGGDGDGSYLLHIYVDEEPTAEIRECGEDFAETPCFHVPSGRLVGCGVEYAAADPFHGNSSTPGGGLGKYSHMGGMVQLPAGDYALETWRCRWAKDAFAKRMIAVSGEAAWKRHRRGTILEAMLFFGLVVAGLGLVGVSLVKAARAALTLPVLLAGWALFIVFLLAYPRLSSRLKSPAAWEAERQAKLDLPAFVLRLTTLA